MSYEAIVAIGLAANLACALICSFVASRSGHDAFSWALAGGLIGPFALLALLAVRSRDRSSGIRAAAVPGGQVLVPTDGSEASLAAVDHVIASRPRAGIVTLLAVFPEERREAAESTLPTLRREFEAHVEGHFAEARRRLEGVGISCRTEVRFGDPATEIVRFATEGGFEQIVMGRRGRGGVAKLLLGSVSEQVVKNARVPVTVAG
jgi:nucleotide-binding universal stress UspA family protein